MIRSALPDHARSLRPRLRTPFTGAAILLAGLTALGCGGDGEGGAEADQTGPAGTIVVADAGLATPESVLHDTGADVYLVANINGASLDQDGNGFISRLSPEGEVLELKWIDGQADGVILNAPKGMALQGDRLYVADIDCLRVFDRTTGEPAGDVCVNGATFLNDVAVGPDGSIFFTDSGMDGSFSPTGTDAVYRLVDGERLTTVYADPEMGAPNGIAVGARGIMVVTIGSGELFQLDASGNRTDVMAPGDMQLDGLEMMPDGGFIMSSWGDSCVYRVDAQGTIECIVEGVDAPADIGVDHLRNRVLVPLFNADEVWIVPLG